MKYDQIINELNQCRNILQQNDHHGRKMAFEVARKLKELHPEIEMPCLAKYEESEAKADALRERINELEAELENATE